MTDTTFLKYKKNQLSPLKKYLIYKAICEGKSIRTIKKHFNCSIETILKIKNKAKNSLIPYFEVDELGYLIYKIKEKNPFFSLKDIQLYLKQNYNIKFSISTISNKLKFYCLYSFEPMPKDILELFKVLISDKKFVEACEILKYYRLSYENYYLLENLPDDYLPIPSFCDKVIYLIENKKLSYEQQLDYLKKIDIMLKNYYNDLNYYNLLQLKFYILKVLGNFEEVVRIYNNEKENINKLPLFLKMEFYKEILSCSLSNHPDIAHKIVFKILKIKKYPYIKSLIFRTLVSLGYINKALNYSREPVLDFMSGKYRKFNRDYGKFQKIIEGTNLKIIYDCLFAQSKLLSNEFFNFLQAINNIIYDVKIYKFYTPDYLNTLALKYAIEGDYKKVREILKEGITNTQKAILTKNYKILSKYRKQELLLKYLIIGNLKRAIKVAKKYGLVYNLYLYAILLNKSQKRLKKYKEFRNVLNLLKLKRHYKVRIYILRKKETIYLGNKLIRYSNRVSKAYLILYYLLNERGRKVSLNEMSDVIRTENITNLIYKLNYNFGFRLVSRQNNFIKLNMDNIDFYFDFNEFLRLLKLGNRSSAFSIYKNPPFIKASDKFPFFNALKFYVILNLNK